jgi:hypothetical protein
MVYAAFDHLEIAAFCAISLRFLADKAAALALPPLLAPSLPKATANGFLAGCGGGEPVVWATMRAASELVSFSSSKTVRLLARLGIPDFDPTRPQLQKKNSVHRFKMIQYQINMFFLIQLFFFDF